MTFSCRTVLASNVKQPSTLFVGSIALQNNDAAVELRVDGVGTFSVTASTALGFFANADYTGAQVSAVWAKDATANGTGVGWHVRVNLAEGILTGAVNTWRPLLHNQAVSWTLPFNGAERTYPCVLQFSRSSQGPSEFSCPLTLTTAISP